METQSSDYYLSMDEMNHIIAAAKNLKESVVLKMLARTGIRRFELANIRVNHVDLERKRIFIERGKGGSKKKPKSRTVVIEDDLAKDIRFFLGSRKNGFLIESNRRNKEGISLSQINRIVANCANRAGITNPNPKRKNMNPHIFRHSFSRLSLASGIPVNMLQKLAGHQDPKTTIKIYGNPSVDDIQEHYEEKLVDKFHQKPKQEDEKLSSFTDEKSTQNS